MSPRPTALLVMPAGAPRRAAAAALKGAAFDVRTASEPYAATASFAERPTDLVVLDLGTFRPRDRAFLRVVRRRSQAARVLLLLPEGARRQAVAALEAGADAYVLDPFHPGELVAVAKRLLRDRLEGGLGADPGPLIRLSTEVAHAVNNPLQVLSLAAEASGPRAPLADPTLRETVGRIRDVVALLNAYGRLGPPNRQPVDLGRLLRTAVESAQKAGHVRLAGPAPKDGPEALADAAQVREALGALLQYTAARAEAAPAEVSARCRPARKTDPTHRLQVLAVGLVLTPEEISGAPGIVLTSHERTRQPHPGLALPAAVARLHGGRLALVAGRRGLVLTLRLPR